MPVSITAFEDAIHSSQSGAFSRSMVNLVEDSEICLTSQLFSHVQFRQREEECFQTNEVDTSDSDEAHVIQQDDDVKYDSSIVEDFAPTLLRTPVCVTFPLTLEKRRRSEVYPEKVFLELSRGIWKNRESYSRNSFILATPKEVEASFALKRESPFFPDSSFSNEAEEKFNRFSYTMESESNSLKLRAENNPSFSFIPIQPQPSFDEPVDDVSPLFELSLPTLNLKPKRAYRDISDWTFD
jgi:hypothetical protein